MADFKKSSTAPAGTGLNSRPAHDQGGAPKTGFADAPTNDAEQANFAAGPGVPPSNRKIH